MPVTMFSTIAIALTQAASTGLLYAIERQTGLQSSRRWMRLSANSTKTKNNAETKITQVLLQQLVVISVKVGESMSHRRKAVDGIACQLTECNVSTKVFFAVIIFCSVSQGYVLGTRLFIFTRRTCRMWLQHTMLTIDVKNISLQIKNIKKTCFLNFYKKH